MSIRYERAVVLTLKLTRWPLFALMSVAKPWMLELPEPETPHSLSGFPGFVFSQAMGFVTGAAHGSAARAVRDKATKATSKPTASNPAGAARLNAVDRRPLRDFNWRSSRMRPQHRSR